MTTNPIFKKVITILLGRPTLYTSILLAVISAFIIWPLVNLYRDLPLPADKIQSQLLKVDAVQLEQVGSRLLKYRQPQPVEPVTTIFRSAGGS